MTALKRVTIQIRELGRTALAAGGELLRRTEVEPLSAAEVEDLWDATAASGFDRTSLRAWAAAHKNLKAYQKQLEATGCESEAGA